MWLRKPCSPPPATTREPGSTLTSGAKSELPQGGGNPFTESHTTEEAARNSGQHDQDQQVGEHALQLLKAQAQKMAGDGDTS